MVISMKNKYFIFLISLAITVISFNLPSVTVCAENIRITVDSLNIKNAKPEMINGTIYLPLRSIFEALGWNVHWDPMEKSVTCSFNNRDMYFKLGSKDIYIDKVFDLMDSPLILIKNKSYIPKKLITEQFGIKVRWDKKNNIIITSDKDTTSITVNGGNNVIIVGEGIIVNIFEPYSENTVSDMISLSNRLLSQNNAEEAIKK